MSSSSQGICVFTIKETAWWVGRCIRVTLILFKIKHFTLYFISKRLVTHRQWILVLLITYCLYVQASSLALSYYCSRVSNSDSRLWLPDHLLNSFSQHFVEEVSSLLFSLDPPEKAPYCVTFCHFWISALLLVLSAWYTCDFTPWQDVVFKI
jgi:hypothetical protein